MKKWHKKLPDEDGRKEIREPFDYTKWQSTHFKNESVRDFSKKATQTISNT